MTEFDVTGGYPGSRIFGGEELVEIPVSWLSARQCACVCVQKYRLRNQGRMPTAGQIVREGLQLKPPRIVSERTAERALERHKEAAENRPPLLAG